MACNPSQNPLTQGPARCGALRLDRIYSNFLVMVDIVDFDPAEDAAVGILARIQPNAGAGAVNGYAFTFQVQDQDVQISRVTGEAPTALAGSPAVSSPLVPGGNYRMVFFGLGDYLEGRIYDMANPGVPLVTNSATDATYTQGTCGIVVFSDTNTRTSGAFDNYSASDGTRPAPDIAMGDGVVRVSWPAAAYLAHDLHLSSDLVEWIRATELIYEDGRAVFTDPVNPGMPRKFFRLKLGP